MEHGLQLHDSHNDFWSSFPGICDSSATIESQRDSTVTGQNLTAAIDKNINLSTPSATSGLDSNTARQNTINFSTAIGLFGFHRCRLIQKNSVANRFVHNLSFAPFPSLSIPSRNAQCSYFRVASNWQKVAPSLPTKVRPCAILPPTFVQPG